MKELIRVDDQEKLNFQTSRIAGAIRDQGHRINSVQKKELKFVYSAETMFSMLNPSRPKEV